MELKPKRKFYDYEANIIQKQKLNILFIDLMKDKYNELMKIALKRLKRLIEEQQDYFKFYKNKFYL